MQQRYGNERAHQTIQKCETTMNNKYAIGTVIGAALLGLAKSSLLGSKNDGVVVRSIEELLEYANDPRLAPLVTEVNFLNKNLTTLPPEIGNLKNLEVLYLIGNKLKTLPPEIGNLTKLEVLNLNRNKLTTLPPEIGNLTNLKGLNLSSNQLTTLPAEIGNLTNLRWLYLDSNQFTTLPPEIGHLKNLERLYLRGNPRFYMNPEQLHQLILNGANQEIQRVIVSANVIPTISNVRLR